MFYFFGERIVDFYFEVYEFNKIVVYFVKCKWSDINYLSIQQLFECEVLKGILFRSNLIIILLLREVIVY